HVFVDPEGLMENLVKVDAAMDKHFGEDNNPYPKVIRNRNRKYFHIDPDGNFWRLMEFVPDSMSYDIAESAQVAYEGAAAFGLFQRVMNSERASDYIPTIPDFHHLGKRLLQLNDAITRDAFGRVAMARREITIALDRHEYANELEELLRNKVVPMRVTHNDTKLNNVLFSKDTGKYICVVDLDTVMPGTVLYDYGDMVRTFTSPVEEDEPDPAKVIFREEIFEALTRGYLSQLKDNLVAGEKDNLLFGGKIMLLMIGVRFLTDFLEGDHYFKTSRENHNLERCRNQFALLEQIENNEYALKKIIHSCL
ncbi:MAG TPA: aminoglycoside phosphotransferase family protein, partial [Bacteroidales bacterium]|nr:aminoglycoside phosphotransferase family protein [Bacteroidales bacterium]